MRGLAVLGGCGGLTGPARTAGVFVVQMGGGGRASARPITTDDDEAVMDGAPGLGSWLKKMSD